MSQKYNAHEIQLRNWIREIVQAELAELGPNLSATTAASSVGESKVQQKPLSSTSAACIHETSNKPQFRLGTPIPDPMQKPPILQKRARPPRALLGWSDLYRPDFEGFDPPPYLINRERHQLYTQKLP
jgi:hypothetical protein